MPSLPDNPKRIGQAGERQGKDQEGQREEIQATFQGCLEGKLGFRPISSFLFPNGHSQLPFVAFFLLSSSTLEICSPVSFHSAPRVYGVMFQPGLPQLAPPALALSPSPALLAATPLDFHIACHPKMCSLLSPRPLKTSCLNSRSGTYPILP